MKKIRILSLLSLLVLFLTGCDKNGESSKALLPKASGRAGDLIVVMDSAQWKGKLGEEIRNTFRAEVSGLPREEYMFKLNRIDPQRFNSILKTVKNLLFVVTLDNNSSESRVVKNYFTQSSIKRIRENDDLFVYTASDEFARGQEIMYLFGQNEDALINNIKQNRSRLQNYFNQAENDRLTTGLYKSKELKGISDMLIKEHQSYMRIPFGYKLVVNEPGFVWVRQINDDNDKNVFITYKNYTSDKSFTNEEIIKLRDSIAMNQLFEDPEDPSTHLETVTNVPFIPVTSKRINFNDLYAMETRGLWKTNNNSMGGPFVSYTLVDEELNRLYYIEGFVYSPGESQREFMREMEVILSTFRTSEDLPKNNN